jgi:mono/diheme cytochrome c family protein
MFPLSPAAEALDDKRHNRAMSMPQRCLALSLLIAVVASVAGCGPEPLTKQQMQGMLLYEDRCAHCHRDNDLALKKVPPDLHGIFKSSKLPSGAPATDAEVTRVILEGKGMMPAFSGRFTQEQIAALLAYLHTGLR